MGSIKKPKFYPSCYGKQMLRKKLQTKNLEKVAKQKATKEAAVAKQAAKVRSCSYLHTPCCSWMPPNDCCCFCTFATRSRLPRRLASRPTFVRIQRATAGFSPLILSAAGTRA